MMSLFIMLCLITVDVVTVADANKILAATTAQVPLYHDGRLRFVKERNALLEWLAGK